ncbi:nucleotidyltransferase family protein [Paenibacillus brevis]
MSYEMPALIELRDASCLEALILGQQEMIADLQAVASLQLPQGRIAAGYIRNFVWDILHGYSERTPLLDVDVIYYDPDCLDEEAEKEIDARLGELVPKWNWSAKNQARMHLRNGHRPYESAEDAMRYWPETATAVAAFWTKDGMVQISAPLGLEDLLHLRLRENPICDSTGTFEQRVQSKRWLELWPRLKLVSKEV